MVSPLRGFCLGVHVILTRSSERNASLERAYTLSPAMRAIGPRYGRFVVAKEVLQQASAAPGGPLIRDSVAPMGKHKLPRPTER